jgi:hypothetical protein
MSAKGTRGGRPGDVSRRPPNRFGLSRTAAFAALVVVTLPNVASARVLDESDLARIAQIKTSFTEVVTDVSRSSQRPDLSGGDSECIKSTLRELMQISQDLKPYEYLITIEDELRDFDDDSTLRGVVRFAVDNAIKILESERRRMGELSDQCSRYPLSAGKTKQAIQFIDGTAAILKSVQPRM